MKTIPTNGLMSYFNAPIAPIKDKAGRIVKNCTLTPCQTLSVQEVYRLIAGDETLRRLTLDVRNAADLSTAKRNLLPYVTPFGTFSRRKCEGLTAFSGLLPIDVDKLESREEAELVKHRLFDDPYLETRLAFISPGGHGVKAFIPWPSCSLQPDEDPATAAARHVRLAMDYVALMHDPHPDDRSRGVDLSGKDVVRACFLCHDAEAMIKIEN